MIPTLPATTNPEPILIEVDQPDYALTNLHGLSGQEIPIRWEYLDTPPATTTNKSAITNSAVCDWLSPLLANTRQLHDNSRYFDNADIDLPNDTAINAAAEIIRAFAEIDLEPSRVVPSSDEGVCISFVRDQIYADIECFNEGDSLAVIDTGKGEPDIWNPKEYGVIESVLKIAGFLG